MILPDRLEDAGDLCGSAQATGNLVQDAWFAALAIESGCEWITSDRDYARGFPVCDGERRFDVLPV